MKLQEYEQAHGPLLEENGYVYPADYLLGLMDAGDAVYFTGDREWLAYMTVRAQRSEPRTREMAWTSSKSTP